MLPQELARVSV